MLVSQRMPPVQVGALNARGKQHHWHTADLRFYTSNAFHPVNLLSQTLCKVRQDEEQVLMVALYWATWTWSPELRLLATAPSWRIPLRKDLLSQGLSTVWHQCPDLGTSICDSCMGRGRLKWSAHRQWKTLACMPQPSLRG